MKKLFSFLALLVFATASSADFNDGVFAFAKGEYGKAYNTMRSLAETSNHAIAQYYVAKMYHEGKGVGQNDDEAAEWFRKAAEQRVSQAQYHLGDLYFNGKGLPKDYEYAYAWYRVGAEHKHKKSMAALDAAKSHLSKDEFKEAEKLAGELIRKYGPLPDREGKSENTKK